MTIHREGKGSILAATSLVAIINLLFFYTTGGKYGYISALIVAFTFIPLLLIVYFFRIPSRQLLVSDHVILAPCDGKVVVVEEVQPDEYFLDKRIQVSIFMSVFNVHVNLNPVGGEVVYSRYHKGKHLVAWHPKSSSANERHCVVYKLGNGKEVMAKQIAGALAKRIVNYLKVGQRVHQGAEMGFIKFGSRVDLFLPLDTKIKVRLGDIVKGGITEVAEWK